MGRDRSVTIILSVIMLATVVLAAGLFTSPMYSSDRDIEGEWFLVHVKGYDSDGNYVSHEVSDPASNLIIKTTAKGAVNGSIRGVPFTGASDTGGGKGMLRFSISSGGNNTQAVGGMNISGILNLVTVTYDAGGASEALSLTYTRDGKVPHMIDSFSQNLTGKWVLNSEVDIGVPVSMNIISQAATTAQGDIKYDDDPAIGFRMALSVLEIGSMSLGLMIDDNNTIWLISVKKGLMILYRAETSAGSVDGTAAYMVRNIGHTIVTVPLNVEGTSWEGTEGFDEDGNEVVADEYSIRVDKQNDYIIWGKLTFNGTEYDFMGAFVAAYQSGLIATELTALAEICMNIGGTEVRAMLFAHGTDKIIISVFGGTLPGDLISMEFVV
jgi:hypothetical protein